MNFEALTKTQIANMTSITRAQCGLPSITRRDVSIQSHPKDRAAKRHRHAANAELRAGLHREKRFTSQASGRAAIQARIDAIGAGGQSNG